jgi:hypothetical protein
LTTRMVEHSVIVSRLGCPRRNLASSLSVRDRLALEKASARFGAFSGCYQEIAMAFSRGPLRVPARTRDRGPVFAIRRRLHVACASDRSARATLTDGDDRPLATLGNGAEVAILAWRPNSSGNTRYRVRATDSGLEGWLPVGNLRVTKAAVSPAPAAPFTSPASSAPLRGERRGASERRGQRRP